MKNITIAKSIGSEAATDEQLARINLFTRRELAADKVFVFSVILCDNEIDRDGEQFPVESLEALGELFIGKTGVFDHDPKAENQSARIFETKLIAEDGLNSLGEQYHALKAWAYMVRCDKNTDLILEIDAGIKKEVSVGCSVEQVVCSICGANQKTAPCIHVKGKVYDGVICCHKLINPTDAYEWSFVAVPAQKNAGVTKKSKKIGTAKFERSEILTKLTKLFDCDVDVELTKFELHELKKEYDELAAMAQNGRAYMDSLRREVVKLAALAQPEISANAMESVAKKLDLSELLELQKSFAKSAAKAYPIAPQLASRVQVTTFSTDNQFKI